MGQDTPNILIAIPIKTGEDYENRKASCLSTWLRNCPVDYRFFSDKDLNLKPNQRDVRPLRTKLMCKYALDHGYDYIFRTDADAYVYVDRLLRSGFEQHDYVGLCTDYPKHLGKHRTAHGGAGFFLSRKAMEVIARTPARPCTDGKFWGDIWVGQVLFVHGIYCHRDIRFLEGQGRQDISPDEVPQDHPYISIHPVMPDNQKTFHARASIQTAAPDRNVFEPEYNFSYGPKSSDCSCPYCKS